MEKTAKQQNQPEAPLDVLYSIVDELRLDDIAHNDVCRDQLRSAIGRDS